MKKLFLLTAMLTLATVIAVGQTNKLTKENAAIKESGLSKSPGLNKNITLCNELADTLTYDRIKHCNELKINNDMAREITSYTLIIIYPDGSTIHEYKGTGNRLPEITIERIISSGTHKIWLENVTVKDGSGFKDLGSRCYNF